jgi:hypothetical protein
MTTLRAGIIVGSGSASLKLFDLVNKLPVMITPKWLNTRCQPIAITDVLHFYQKHYLILQLTIKVLILRTRYSIKKCF